MQTLASIDTLADLVERLGGVPLHRILMRPPPGMATEADVQRVEETTNQLCELVDGVLVEKAIGFRESLLAIAVAGFLRDFISPRNLGLVTGADGMMRLSRGLIRIPDVAFIAWESLPDRRVPDVPIPDLAPDLAVEVLSRSNTVREMELKRREYFAAGVRLVWIVDPDLRTVTAFTSPEDSREYAASESLDGGEVLPDFLLPLQKLFAELDRHGK